MMRRSLALVLALSTLTACGGEEAAPADGMDPADGTVEEAAVDDGCPWFDAPLVSGILGETVTVSGGASSGSCTIEAVPATTSAWVTVLPSASIDTEVQGVLSRNPTAVPNELSGVGDRAVWVPLPPMEGVSSRGMVFVVKGTQLLTVTVNRSASAPDQPDLGDRAVTLAQAIVTQM